MTHIFQSEDKDVGDLTFLENNLPTKNNKSANNALIAASNVWEYFEKALLYDFINGYEETAYYNNGKCPYKVTIDTKVLKDCLNDIFQKALKTFPDANIDFIRKFIKLQLVHEADAYTAGAKAYRKFKKQPVTKEDLFTPELYKSLTKHI